MKKLLLFTMFLGTAPVFAQQTDAQDLLAIKASVEREISTLKDSLQQITRRIDSIKSLVPTQEPIKKYSLGPNELMALENLKVRLEPDINSKVVLELDKGTPVLKIDLIGDFYLICYEGTCGYAPQALLEDNKNGQKEDERGSAPNS